MYMLAMYTVIDGGNCVYWPVSLMVIIGGGTLK